MNDAPHLPRDSRNRPPFPWHTALTAGALGCLGIIALLLVLMMAVTASMGRPILPVLAVLLMMFAYGGGGVYNLIANAHGLRTGRAEASQELRTVRLVIQALQGLLYFAGSALIASLITQASFWLVYLMMLAIIVGCTFLGVWLIVGRFTDSKNVGLQFSLGTLLAMLFFVAVFLGCARWFTLAAVRVDQPELLGRAPQEQFAHYVGWGIGQLAWLALSIPFAMRLTDSVVWLLAWLLRKWRRRRQI